MLNNTISVNTFNEMCSSMLEDKVLVYTNGSKVKDKVRCGNFVPHKFKNILETSLLAHSTSIFNAEIIAIVNALDTL